MDEIERGMAEVMRPFSAEQRLDLAEQASGIGTFEHDLVSGRWTFSPQASRLFGFEAHVAPPTFAEWERVIFPDDALKLRMALDSAKGGGAFQVEIRVRHRDDTLHWLSAKGSVVQADGQARHLSGAFIEITERKALEARLLALNETLEARVSDRTRDLAASMTKLAETERRFRLLIDAVTDYAIFMLDRDGRVVSWNPGAQRIKGYAPDEILGQHFSRFYSEDDRRGGVPERALATAMKTGKYEAEGWRVRKDGSAFWASVVLNAIHDPDQGLVGFAKVTRDLTEKRTADEQLRQAQKMEALGQLTGGVAHDFNNVLTVISGNIEALLRLVDDGGDRRIDRFGNAALRGAERAAILVQQLLAFSRRQPLDPKPMSVHALLAGTTDLLRRAIGEAIAIETVVGAGVWPIFADRNQLESALLNLAINARDAMPEGGRLTIEASNADVDETYAGKADIAPGQYVCVAVSDTGTGMDRETQSRAFDPFFTTKPPGQGTGLGLSQVYGFVRQSGGHVRIYSEIGEGTTIKIYLPRHLMAHIADEERASAVALPRAKDETVLVVEDDSDVRNATTEMLRELGYRVLEAADGSVALRLLDANRATRLVLTDVGLPGGMNGRQFADEAKRRHPHLKVLFTSGYARNAIVHHGRLDPGVELIAKPFTFAALASRVRHLLDAP